METILEEYGQAILALVASVPVVGWFIWLLDMVTAF